ncbi:hypothetical protein, partial [Enterobacter cloacae complex sp. 4DZ1-17B1]|uniref:hypothetical protein n=1 Tax=Enterobacter cloacae complex sp. 4DZ1-17B1 TaxID=2511991 RepID=UPI0013EB6D6C
MTNNSELKIHHNKLQVHTKIQALRGGFEKYGLGHRPRSMLFLLQMFMIHHVLAHRIRVAKIAGGIIIIIIIIPRVTIRIGKKGKESSHTEKESQKKQVRIGFFHPILAFFFFGSILQHFVSPMVLVKSHVLAFLYVIINCY